MKIFDSHCHLYDENEPEKLIYSAAENGVEGFVVVGTSYETSKKTVEIVSQLQEDFPELDIYSAIGLHPHDASESFDRIEELVRETLKYVPNGLVAIGECGLDYYYNHCEPAIQLEAFRRQIELAKQLNLALIVHTRDAWDDTFRVLDEQGAPKNTIIHCFTGGLNELTECLKRNFTISFSGIVTFKNSIELQRAAIECPTRSLLVETDSPFLAPEPFRGKQNSPKNVIEVLKKIIELKQTDLDETATTIFTNTQRVFNLI